MIILKREWSVMAAKKKYVEMSDLPDAEVLRIYRDVYGMNDIDARFHLALSRGEITGDVVTDEEPETTEPETESR